MALNLPEPEVRASDPIDQRLRGQNFQPAKATAPPMAHHGRTTQVTMAATGTPMTAAAVRAGDGRVKKVGRLDLLKSAGRDMRATPR